MPFRPPDLRVLLADPAPLSTSTLTTILHACGYRIARASSAMEALELADSLDPHALLSAVDLPGLDGFELARQIKAAHPTCRCLFMAEHLSPMLRLEVASAAAPQPTILSKPPSPRAVLAFLTGCADALSPEDSQTRQQRGGRRNSSD